MILLRRVTPDNFRKRLKPKSVGFDEKCTNYMVNRSK
jgi:hypothetical protein